MSLTICMTTSRPEPELFWMLESLESQVRSDESHSIKMMMIDLHKGNRNYKLEGKLAGLDFTHAFPKPNIFQGEHRLTKEDWWAVSNARNTALCLCKTTHILFLDDRCVLMPGFMDAVREAMAGNYIMAGAYEKRQMMTVENGIIKNGGIIQAVDSRESYVDSTNSTIPFPCGGEWLFGCCLLLPLEWALQVNGYPERCNALSFEDVIFGLLLANNKFPMKFDPRAKIIEDRTPEKLGTPMRRESKERHPNDTSDKAHTSLRWVRTAMRSDNDYDIMELRAKIQVGEPFPIPSDPDAKDWFDGQLVREFK